MVSPGRLLPTLVPDTSGEWQEVPEVVLVALAVEDDNEIP